MTKLLKQDTLVHELSTNYKQYIGKYCVMNGIIADCISPNRNCCCEHNCKKPLPVHVTW